MSVSDSWWLKLKRAQKHLVDIQKELRQYSDSKPYEVVRLEPTKKQPLRWRYVLSITEPPNPMLPIMVGDFVHNLRAALDHFVANYVPANRSRNAYFPMLQRDIWERDSVGHLLRTNRDARRSYKSATKGLPDLALAAVEAVQPYHLHVAGFGQTPLGILSRLENADKHRDLIPISVDVRLSLLLLIRNEIVIHETLPEGKFVQEGTVVAAFTAAPDLQESEVHVQVSGPLHISIKLPALGGGKGVDRFEITKIMLDALKHERFVLRLLEATVAPDAPKSIASFFDRRDRLSGRSLVVSTSQ